MILKRNLDFENKTIASLTRRVNKIEKQLGIIPEKTDTWSRKSITDYSSSSDED